MPYIDLNELKKDVINSWNNDKHRTAEASRIHNQEHKDLMLIVGRQPTADVVPKSKYQQLQHKYNLAVAEREANVKGFTEDLAKAKTDTAREIFAEIEKCLRQRLSDEVAGEYRITEEDLAELKKKYTEDDDG